MSRDWLKDIQNFVNTWGWFLFFVGLSAYYLFVVKSWWAALLIVLAVLTYPHPKIKLFIEKTVPWLFGIYVILFALAWIDWGFIKHEITAYPIHCAHQVGLTGQCDNVDFALRTTTYKIDKKNQAVLNWVQGFEVYKLTNCAIRNRKNWTCQYSDSDTEFGFIGDIAVPGSKPVGIGFVGTRIGILVLDHDGNRGAGCHLIEDTG